MIFEKNLPGIEDPCSKLQGIFNRSEIFCCLQ